MKAAVLAALFGSVVAGLTIVMVGADGEAWSAIVGTSVAVQILAQLTGTGFGLIVPRAWMASALTIVAPMAVFRALAGSDLQAWLTPYGALLGIFAADADGADWLRWLVMFAIWGVR